MPQALANWDQAASLGGSLLKTTSKTQQKRFIQEHSQNRQKNKPPSKSLWNPAWEIEGFAIPYKELPQG